MALALPLHEIVEKSSNPLLKIHPTWERVQLAEIAEILNGFAFKSAKFNNSKGFPLLRIRDILNNSTACLYDGPYDSAYIVESGDYIIGMDGNFNFAKWEGPAALLNQRVCKITIQSNKFIPKFLEYVLPSYLKAINENTSSVTVKHLSSKSVGEIPIPLPPLPEQHRIVTKLETLLAQVNRSKDHLIKVPLHIKRFRQSLLAAACSGRLTEDWRRVHPDVEPASELLDRIREERIRRYEEECQKAEAEGRRKPKKPKNLEPQGVDTEGLPELPERWVWTQIPNISSNHDGKRIPVKDKDRQKMKGDYPYYGASGIIDYVNGFLFDGDYLLIGEDGANLVSRSKPIAFKASGKFWVNNHAHVLEIEGGIPIEFVEAHINGIDLVPYVTGSAQPKLTQKKLDIIPIPLPPLSEQIAIVKRVETLFHFADEAEQRVTAATTHTNHLTLSILARAFRGELVPQDPRDEPASVLLERIKQERAKNEMEKKTGKRKAKTVLDYC
jgi:type I restriction enzyme S subunit